MPPLITFCDVISKTEVAEVLVSTALDSRDPSAVLHLHCSNMRGTMVVEPKPAVGIKDVAALAEVSIATVSRVLAGMRVRPAYRERVLAVLATVDYRPNLAARRLRASAAGTVGLIVPDTGNPFFTRLIRAVEDAAWARRLRVLVCNSDEDAGRESAYLDMLREERVSGVLLAPTLRSVARTHGLLRTTPTVLIDRVPDDAVQDGVQLDNQAGAEQLVRALADRGCRSLLGLFSADSVAGAERQAAFARNAARLGLRAQTAVVPHPVKDRADAVRQALAGDAGVDGIVTGNSLILLEVARHLGPGAFRHLATFDSAPWHGLLSDGLLVLDQPAEALGQTALDFLSERMAGLEGPARRHKLPGTLQEVRRGTEISKMAEV